MRTPTLNPCWNGKIACKHHDDCNSQLHMAESLPESSLVQIAQTSSLLHHHQFGSFSPIILEKEDVFSVLISSSVPEFLEMHDAASDFCKASANGPLSFVLVLLQYSLCCFEFLRCSFVCIHPPTAHHLPLSYLISSLA